MIILAAIWYTGEVWLLAPLGFAFTAAAIGYTSGGIVITVLWLGLLLIPPLVMPIPQTFYAKNFPFEDDFHLSKNAFSQGGYVNYVFNVTHRWRRINISIESADAFNFKLISETGYLRNETLGVFSVSESALLTKGTWTLWIEAFHSSAEGILSLDYGFMSWMDFLYIEVSQDEARFKMTYIDSLQETISVHITITAHDIIGSSTRVWNRTVNGSNRNRFDIVWDSSSNLNIAFYEIQYNINHGFFGDVKWSDSFSCP